MDVFGLHLKESDASGSLYFLAIYSIFKRRSGKSCVSRFHLVSTLKGQGVKLVGVLYRDFSKYSLLILNL